jgi:hypothetical protein
MGQILSRGIGMTVSLADAIIESLAVHRRLPRTIQRYLEATYETSISLEAIVNCLETLEQDGRVQRYSHPSGRVTDLWETCNQGHFNR